MPVLLALDPLAPVPVFAVAVEFEPPSVCERFPLPRTVLKTSSASSGWSAGIMSAVISAKRHFVLYRMRTYALRSGLRWTKRSA